MARTARGRARRQAPAARPRAKRQTRASGRTKRWWQAVSALMFQETGPRIALACSARMFEKTDSEFLSHSVSTTGVTWASGAYVGIQSDSFGFGAGVPVVCTKNASGYSFSGGLPVCTKNSVCDNGKPMIWHIKLQGEIKYGDPDELSYNYSIVTTCGGVPTCTEVGTFKAPRFAGTAGSIDGSFSGTQEWRLKCCPVRHSP
jgi:hypothetical protein